MAAIAASFICCGVEKCGSPAPNSTRSAPAALSFAASATTAMVAETSIRFTRSLNCLTSGRVAMIHPRSNFCCRTLKFFTEPLLHQLRYQTPHRTTKSKNLFHQSRTQVGISLGRHHEDCFQMRLEFAVHQGHLQFVLIVADGANTTQDRFGLLLHRVIHQQPLEYVDADVFVGPNHFFQHGATL